MIQAASPPRSTAIGRSPVALCAVAVAFAIGCRPGEVQTDPLITAPADDPKTQAIADSHGVEFVDVAAGLGLDYVWPQQPRPMRTDESFGNGCALLDYDRDGWLDVLLVCDPHARLYRNTHGRFEDVTTGSGLTVAEGDWTGCAVGDYDGDGWPDILLTGIHHLALFKNDGGKRFVETTKQAGLDRQNGGHWGASAGFMDLDGDAYLDLVIINYVVFGPDVKQYCEITPGVISGCPPREYTPERGEIWRNTGAGGFELLPESAGMQDTSGVGMVLAFTDLDDDGRMDFYIGNDGAFADLMHNQGGMTFKNIGHFSGVAAKNFNAMAAMGADWADFDRDGLLDLTVTNYQGLFFTVFRNAGDKFFVDAGGSTDISPKTRDRLGFGAKWLDMNNDGWPDLSYANGHVYDNVDQIHQGHLFRQPLMLFLNQEGKKFVDVAPTQAAEVGRPLVGRGSATGDFNNDGRIDLLVVDFEGPVMLLENRTQSDNHWITFDLQGQAPNVLAYGAKITANAGDQVWVSQVSPASSYMSSSDPRVHFGLGAVNVLDNVTVRWPDGEETTLKNVVADQILPVDRQPAGGQTPP